jgi:hypothetical protein
MPAERTSGLVATAVPFERLSETDKALEALVDYDLALLPDPIVRRLERLEKTLSPYRTWFGWPKCSRNFCWHTPAVSGHDARFSPSQVTMLMGDLPIRADAARAKHAVPRAFICGSSAETTATMRNSRLIVLGC